MFDEVELASISGHSFIHNCDSACDLAYLFLLVELMHHVLTLVVEIYDLLRVSHEARTVMEDVHLFGVSYQIESHP